MTNITLKQLKYFDAVARFCHFGLAADACTISQPALSMQIKDLELTLGMQLFERGARNVRLTRFGEQLVPHARQILQSVDELSDLARAAQDQLTGSFRIGVIPTISPYLLPTFIGNLTRVFVDLEIQVRETLTEKLLAELAEGRLDAAIVALPISEPMITEIALFDEPFVLIRPEKDAATAAPNRDLLSQERLLLLEEGHCFRDQALSFCNSQSPTSRKGLDASSLSTLVQMVGAGLGLTLIPKMAVPVETRSAKVSISSFQDPQPCRTIGMIWRKSNPLAEQFLEVAEIVRQSARELEDKSEK